MKIRNLCFAVAMASLLCACASVKDVEDYDGTIAPGHGVLAIVINSDTWFEDLRLTRPHDAFAAIAASNVTKGRSVRFVELPAGEYEWARIDLNTGGYMHEWIPLDAKKQDRYRFTVKAGVINYPGDFVVGSDSRYWGRYYIQLIDRSAMFLTDLTPDQKRMLDKSNWSYTGPGLDDFPGYFRNLVAVKEQQP